MDKVKEIHLRNLDEKKLNEIGYEIGKNLKAGDLILLKGELGSGKTTLTKAIAHGIGVERDRVRSPSFVIMNIYSNHLKIYHMDLYRLKDEEDFISAGLMEFLQMDDGVTVVEWADRISGIELDEFLEITIDFEGEGKRSMRLRAKGGRFRSMVENLSRREMVNFEDQAG